ncbi:unnamed protein product, partial [Mesorhabditis belari]|uniref:RDD domain-containing protein n=1 Tax=Mesorhabditis belari TaxID=2138241 RepID=A0AAF3EEI8_9BILA
MNKEEEVTKDYGSAAAYAEAVRKWVDDVTRWRAVHHAALTHAFIHAIQNQTLMANQTSTTQATPSAATVQQQLDGSRIVQRRYRYPSYVRRLIAELLDFIFAFIVKLFIIYSLVMFDFIDLDRYEKLMDQQTDLQMIIDITQDLFPLEILGKFVCSFVEALCISYGFFSLCPGQTPGKMIVGIQVISCHNASSVVGNGDMIEVTGSTRVPFKNSLIRASIKNLLVNSLVPLSTIAFAFHHNRAIYDLMAKTVVVFKE